MTGSPVPEAVAQAAEAPFDETGAKRELTGLAAKVVAGAALAFSSYQLVIAAFSPLSSLPTRSIHVGFLLLLAYLMHPISAKSDRQRIAWYDAVIAAVAFALALCHLRVRGRPFLCSARATPGPARWSWAPPWSPCCSRPHAACSGRHLPIICAAFLAYGLFGQYLPSAIAHRGCGSTRSSARFIWHRR